jgi:hypothetical protein
LDVDASVGGIVEPIETRCFYQSVIYKPEHHLCRLISTIHAHAFIRDSGGTLASLPRYGPCPTPKTSANPAGPHVPATGDGESAASTGSPHDAGTATNGRARQLNIDDYSAHLKMSVPLPDSDDGSEDGSGTHTMDRFLPFPSISHSPPALLRRMRLCFL